MAVEKGFSPVAVAGCPTYERADVEKAMQRVIDEIDGLGQIHEGMTVAIKVNLIGGLSPDKAATTHPMPLTVLCEMLKGRGAKVIIGDSPGGPFTRAALESAYKAAQLTPVIEAGATLNLDTSVANTRDDDALVMKSFDYTAWLDQADVIINFAKLKTHAMMTMTCAVKNIFGTIPGFVKPEYHMRFPDIRDFSDMMIDLQEHFKPVLHIVDAIVGMEGNGPTNGTPKKVGAIVAGKSPYTVDLVCADLMGIGIDEVMTLRRAAERGLAPSDVSKVTVLGDDHRTYAAKDYAVATSVQGIDFSGKGMFNKVTAFLTRTFLTTKPMVKPSGCIGCAKCHDVCPAHAITMRDKLPVIDRDVCIRCFCCQEYCPVGAMRIYKHPIGRLAEKL